MAAWTHLVRFLAEEDDQIHLGQLLEPTRDVGLDSVNGYPIKAWVINGTIYNGLVSEHVLTVKKVRRVSGSRLSSRSLTRAS